MYLLDTDICIELLRNNTKIISKIESLTENTRICTSIITVAELIYGACLSNKKEQRLDEVKNFISDIEVLGIDLKAAEVYGKIKSDLKIKGNLISDNDLFIACIAKANNSILVTRNIAHFKRVNGLHIQEWI